MFNVVTQVLEENYLSIMQHCLAFLKVLSGFLLLSGFFYLAVDALEQKGVIVLVLMASFKSLKVLWLNVRGNKRSYLSLSDNLSSLDTRTQAVPLQC